MPYFKNDEVNVLFIHIPKTGGSSLESYFSSKFNIPLNNKSLFMCIQDKSLLHINIHIHLQHITYNQMVEYRKDFNIVLDHLKIITIVRNPYERMVSDLFYFKLMTSDTSPEEVFEILQRYLVADHYDNHNIPQHKFITNEGEMIQNIHILRTESLTNDMKALGYDDFNQFDNVNPYKTDYYKYLNSDSIDLINTFYHLDFVLFHYAKQLP